MLGFKHSPTVPWFRILLVYMCMKDPAFEIPLYNICIYVHYEARVHIHVIIPEQRVHEGGNQHNQVIPESENLPIKSTGNKEETQLPSNFPQFMGNMLENVLHFFIKCQHFSVFTKKCKMAVL